MTNTTLTHSKLSPKGKKNLSRLEKAIQRASFAVLKRYKEIPNDPAHPGVRELQLTINRILDHAERLGWIKLPNSIGKIRLDKTTELDRKKRVAPTIPVVVPRLNWKEYFE